MRITGSPKRLTALRKCRARPGFSSSKTRPVSIKAQVDALTSEEAECPRCLPQSEGAILSSINSSMVSASGTRKSASARHINAMPSSVDRPYSARKTSINPGSELPRILRTSSAAPALMRARSLSESLAAVTRWPTAVASSWYMARSIWWRSVCV